MATLKKLLSYGLLSLLLFIQIAHISCNQRQKDNSETVNGHVQKADDQFNEVLRRHLDAVSNRDLKTLKSTLSPEGTMQLILPETEIITKVEGFLNYHREWFALPDWTFETKILISDVGSTMGMAIVEVVYREPERDGIPYFNRMIVSYDLKKIKGTWYIIKDHASNVEKSTDKIELR